MADRRTAPEKAVASLMYRLLVGLSPDELELLRWAVDKHLEGVARADERTIDGFNRNAR